MADEVTMVVYKCNLNEMKWAQMGNGAQIHHERKTLTPFDQAYLPKFGVSLYRLAPGKRAFPRHEHLANDEGILVTRGSGTLRYGDQEIALAEGDYVHLPAASGRAHHMINTSEAELEYYCFSSIVLPETVLYPDSNKLGAYSLTKAADGGGWQRAGYILRNEPVGYFDGEEPD